MTSTNRIRIGRLNFYLVSRILSMRTELYISYAFYDKDQIEAVNFSINVLTLSKKAKTLITE